MLHEGLHTEEDFQRIRDKKAAGEEPWVSAYQLLVESQFSQKTADTYPTEWIKRGVSGDENYMNAARGATIAYQQALRWKIEQDDEYAAKAVENLNKWVQTCVGVTGNTNLSLAAGLYGYEFAIAGELLRDYEGWDRADFAAFQNWLDVYKRQGSAGPASDQVNTFLEESVQLSETVMGDAAYSLWNYNNVAAMRNMSNRYLFNIEEEASNPAGAGRATNKEFIIASVYSQETRKGQVDLNRVIYTDMRPSRKLIDMFLCTDGLPVSMSDKFQGYKNPGDEFQNRDFRLTSYVGSYATSLTVENCGYGVSKFAITDIQRQSKDESANYPVLRLAEVYLNYAEAVMERYGEISDDQLNKSINKIRARAGIANLTNALAKRIQEGVPANANKTVNQVMLDEIRRERALELYMEGFRCDDLKRWGIAEENLNESRCGAVVGNASYPTAFVDENGNATSAFNPAIFTKGTEVVETGKGKLPCVVLLKSSDCAFTKGDYLWAIPRNQINLNSNLVQNPGY